VLECRNGPAGSTCKHSAEFGASNLVITDMTSLPVAAPTILVVDQMELVRVGLRGILGEGATRGTKIREANSLKDAGVRLLRQDDRIDLVVVGSLLPREIDQLEQFRRHWESVRFCLLIDQLDDDALACGYALDVLGFLHLGATPDEVREAICRMLANQVYLPRSVRPYMNWLSSSQLGTIRRRPIAPGAQIDLATMTSECHWKQ